MSRVDELASTATDPSYTSFIYGQWGVAGEGRVRPALTALDEERLARAAVARREGTQEGK